MSEKLSTFLIVFEQIQGEDIKSVEVQALDFAGAEASHSLDEYADYRIDYINRL